MEMESARWSELRLIQIMSLRFYHKVLGSCRSEHDQHRSTTNNFNSWYPVIIYCFRLTLINPFYIGLLLYKPVLKNAVFSRDAFQKPDFWSSALILQMDHLKKNSFKFHKSTNQGKRCILSTVSHNWKCMQQGEIMITMVLQKGFLFWRRILTYGQAYIIFTQLITLSGSDGKDLVTSDLDLRFSQGQKCPTMRCQDAYSSQWVKSNQDARGRTTVLNCANRRKRVCLFIKYKITGSFVRLNQTDICKAFKG